MVTSRESPRQRPLIRYSRDSQNNNYKYFLTIMLMKVAEEESSKILARAEITESTQRLSVKKQKEVVLY